MHSSQAMCLLWNICAHWVLTGHIKYRLTHWWAAIVNGSWLHDVPVWQRDMHYVEQFRLTYPTFKALCDKLRPHIEKKDTQLREAVTVELRVAIALYKLAHGSSYRQIAEPLAVSKSLAVS